MSPHSVQRAWSLWPGAEFSLLGKTPVPQAIGTAAVSPVLALSWPRTASASSPHLRGSRGLVLIYPLSQEGTFLLEVILPETAV